MAINSTINIGIIIIISTNCYKLTCNTQLNRQVQFSSFSLTYGFTTFSF